jgi:hypothetical protein
MGFDQIRDLIEDFAFGVLVTTTWIQDHGKGWVTFGLAVVYGVYKIISQKKVAEGQKLDNDLKRKELEAWDKTRTTIENDLADQVKNLRDMQVTNKQRHA